MEEVEQKKNYRKKNRIEKIITNSDIVINKQNNKKHIKNEDSFTFINSQNKNIKEEKNIPKDSYLYDVNVELERNIEKMKKKYKSSTLKRKIEILKSSYILGYKSLNIKNIFLFWVSIFFGILFLFLALNIISKKILINIPAYGGTLNEGIINVPRYINPVLSISDPDRDLTSLIFSGLLKKDVNGNIVNDLATSIEESDDGLTYKVRINNEAKFQDGVDITSDDLLFTLSKIQDKSLNSPLEINFEGITAEKIDDKTVLFYLKKPYFYFKESLTFGILPKHILKDLSDSEFLMSDFNINPIGSGPYKINKINKQDNVAKKYELISNKNYISGKPYIDNINIYIYQNNDDLLFALNNGTIENTAYLDQSYIGKIRNKNTKIIKSDLPNTFALSLNPNKNSILANKDMRLFLAKNINKDSIIKDIFSYHVVKRDVFFGKNENNFSIENADIKRPATNTEINITTGDIGELKAVAENIANSWRNQGIKVNIIVYSINDLVDAIKNRNFEVLLFGSTIQKDDDLFAYFDSSQRIYPGLNIVDYVSQNMDDNLYTLRNSVNKEKREIALININEELSKEMPIIPLYSKNLNYIVNNKNLADELENKTPKEILYPSGRFIDINDWYKKEEKVWKFSYKKNLIEKLSNILH